MNPEFRHLESDEPNDCAKCGKSLHIGEWPFCPHGFVGRTHHEFEAYYDDGLGEYIPTRDVRKKLLKAANADARDGMRQGDFSARKDRVEADRAERRKEAKSDRLYFI